MAGGGALAFTLFTWVGERTGASAASRTVSHPSHCMGVNMSGDTACWGRTSISSAYCASDGYHRTDTVYYEPSHNRRYYWDAACGGYAGWYWKSGVDPYSTTTSCWDGHYVDYYSGAARPSVTSLCKRSGL